MGRGSRLATVVWAAALAAAGCERERAPAPPAAAEAPARAAGRPDGGKASGRRGDRHARAAERRSREVKRIAGTLARSDGRRVVIRAPGAAPMTLRVAPSTSVTVDGRPARAEALPEGAEVRASYRTGGAGRPTAIAIEAVQPRAPAPPASGAPAPDRSPEPPSPSDGSG